MLGCPPGQLRPLTALLSVSPPLRPSSQVKTQLSSHVLMVVPALAIGAVCGLCAILFTIINLKVGCGKSEL